MAAPKKCEVKDCKEFLGPGAAEIGYEIDGRVYQLKACARHTQLITTAPRGTWQLTKDRELKPMPASFFIQYKKGFK